MIIVSVITKKTGLKTACFAIKSNVKSVYALVQKILPNYRKLEREIKKIKVSNKYIAIVMLYDFWSTGKISGGGYLKKLIVSSFPTAKVLSLQKNEEIWVRINAFKPPENFEKLGIKDDLIENLYLAKRNEEINKLINNFQIIAQSKASCMPVAALNLKKGSWNAIDTCASPGNKTLQLGEMIKKFTTGVVYAYEKDEKRYNLLKSRIESSGSDNIIPIHQDFFTVKGLKNIKVAIVDPSCSGSGIIEHQIADHGKIHNNIYYADSRVENLSKFQQNILASVLNVNGIEQVIYSTCSVYALENENVVEKTMKNYWRKFKLQRVLNKWHDRGIGRYGKYMARCIPSDNNSQGFFVAKIIRRKLRLRHKLIKRSKKYWMLRTKVKYT